MGPWPNSNGIVSPPEINRSPFCQIPPKPPYTLQDIPKLAAKKLLANYESNSVTVSHITITQKYSNSKFHKIKAAAQTSASNNNDSFRNPPTSPSIHKKHPILSNLLTNNTLNSFFNLKLAPTTSDLDLDEIPIPNLNDDHTQAGQTPEASHPPSGHPLAGNSHASHQPLDLSLGSNTRENQVRSISTSAGHVQASHPLVGHTQASHPPTGHTQANHLPEGYTQASQPKAGHTSAGHAPATNPPAGYAQASHPPIGQAKASNPPAGHAQASRHPVGYNQASHPPAGHAQASHPLAGHTQAGQTQGKGNHLPAGHAKASQPQAGNRKAGQSQAFEDFEAKARWKAKSWKVQKFGETRSKRKSFKDLVFILPKKAVAKSPPDTPGTPKPDVQVDHSQTTKNLVIDVPEIEKTAETPETSDHEAAEAPEEKLVIDIPEVPDIVKNAIAAEEPEEKLVIDIPEVPDIVKNAIPEETNVANETECDKCLKSFSTFDSLKHHQFYCNKKSIKKYQCKICQIDFLTAFAFTQHNRSEHDQNKGPNKCQICGKFFPKLTDLTEHLQAEHKVETPIFKCNICDVAFAWKSLLKRHRASKHVKTEPHKCKTCKQIRCKHMVTTPAKDYLFTASKDRLPSEQAKSKLNSEGSKAKAKLTKKKKKPKMGKTTPEMGEGEQKIHKCDQCNYKFTNLGSFSKHKRVIHNQKDKPHQCDRCPKKFAIKPALEIHKQIFHDLDHSAVKPNKSKNVSKNNKKFACTICQRKFSSQQYLKKHSATHILSSMSI